MSNIAVTGQALSLKAHQVARPGIRSPPRLLCPRLPHRLLPPAPMLLPRGLVSTATPASRLFSKVVWTSTQPNLAAEHASPMTLGMNGSQTVSNPTSQEPPRAVTDLEFHLQMRTTSAELALLPAM